MRVSMVALGLGVLSTSGAVAQPDLLSEPWGLTRPSASEPTEAEVQAPPEASNGPGARATEKGSRERASWPAWQAVEVVNPWASESEVPRAGVAAKPVARETTPVALEVEAEVPAPVDTSWAHVVSEPTPRFSRTAPKVEARAAHWARPLTEVINPWRPEPSSWVPVSEVIVNPWSDS